MHSNLVDGRHGHGGIKSKWDPRDYHVSGLGQATTPFDWNKGFDIETVLQAKLGDPSFRIPVEDQGQSSSCGGQAARYYVEILMTLQSGTFRRLSAKDPYSMIFYPGGGTTLKDIARRVGDHGIALESRISSYENGNPPSESFMENKIPAQTTDDSERLAPVSAYARTNLDLDSLAQAAQDNNGVLLLFHGENNGTWRTTIPTPAQSRFNGWNHFIYIGKAKLINGEKYLGVLNSWSAETGDQGWQWFGANQMPMFTESLVFYDKATYTYTPTTTQTVISSLSQYQWVKGFINWLTKYHW